MSSLPSSMPPPPVPPGRGNLEATGPKISTLPFGRTRDLPSSTTDALVSYHLKYSCCPFAGNAKTEAHCVRSIGLAAALFARRLVLAASEPIRAGDEERAERAEDEDEDKEDEQDRENELDDDDELDSQKSDVDDGEEDSEEEEQNEPDEELEGVQDSTGAGASFSAKEAADKDTSLRNPKRPLAEDDGGDNSGSRPEPVLGRRAKLRAKRSSKSGNGDQAGGGGSRAEPKVGSGPWKRAAEVMARHRGGAESGGAGAPVRKKLRMAPLLVALGVLPDVAAATAAAGGASSSVSVSH